MKSLERQFEKVAGRPMRAESIIRPELEAGNKEWEHHLEHCQLCIAEEQLYCPLARRLETIRSEMLAEPIAAATPRLLKESPPDPTQ